MTLKDQKVKYQIDAFDYGTFRNQTITNVIIDDECYAFGKWRGKLVASFHLDNGTWFVM